MNVRGLKHKRSSHQSDTLTGLSRPLQLSGSLGQQDRRSTRPVSPVDEEAFVPKASMGLDVIREQIEAISSGKKLSAPKQSASGLEWAAASRITSRTPVRLFPERSQSAPVSPAMSFGLPPGIAPMSVERFRQALGQGHGLRQSLEAADKRVADINIYIYIYIVYIFIWIFGI